MNEILQLTLLANDSHVVARDWLLRAFERAACARGAVAFWTLPPEQIGPPFAPCLARPESFLCVDIHPPTNVDVLVDLAEQNANILLHLKRLSRGIEGLPPFLLHTKVWLFDFPDGTAELWVGSHNGTQRALLGPNLEASLMVGLTKDASLYREAVTMLEQRRTECRPCDPSERAYYKLLQGQEEATSPVIEVESEDPRLPVGCEVRIFGSEPADLKELGTFGRKVKLSVIDVRSDREQLYETTVRQFGELGDLTFSPHRFAMRGGRRLPRLGPVASPSSWEMQQARYFATLRVDSIAKPELEAFEPLELSPWVRAPEEEQQRWAARRAGTDRKVTIEEPRPPEELRSRKKTLDEKRGEERPLVVRKVVRVRRPEDG